MIHVEHVDTYMYVCSFVVVHCRQHGNKSKLSLGIMQSKLEIIMAVVLVSINWGEPAQAPH